VKRVRILETPRLLLRRFERGDLDALFVLYSDPEMRRFFPDGTRTLQQTKEELEWFLDGHPDNPELGLWATIEKKTGNFLGRCGLLPWEVANKPEMEVAYMIDKARWGEGFATEAALGIVDYAQARLGLQRLICLVMPGNERSASVARKAGMRFEFEHTDAFGLCHVYARSLKSVGEA
jgi:[ribosomal protein S5]-alanine N-acetyltransferase